MRIMRFMKTFFTMTIADSDKTEFSISINKINVMRAKITASVLFTLEVLMLILHCLMNRENLFQAPYIYYGIMYIGMLLFMLVFLAVFIKLGTDVSKNLSRILFAGILYIGFILLWSAGISLLDQLSSGQVIVYIIAVISIAITPIIKPHILLIAYLAVHSLFLIALPQFQESASLIYGNSVNTTTFVIMSWAISYMRYKKHAEDSNNKKTILHKNEELKQVNRQLLEANQKLDALSKTDGLTGITNRLSFEAIILDEWNRCKQESIPLSLIMIDIDFFKEYNDNYGHQTGDCCIKLVAELVKTYANHPAYKVARYGGDELIAVLPNTDKDKALHLAEQCRKGVEEKAVPHLYSQAAKCVTISLGVSTVIPSDDTSIEEFLRTADMALYKAKERRNCSVFVSERCTSTQ